MNRPPGHHRSNSRIAVVHHHALLREGISRILDADDFDVVYQGEDGGSLLGQRDDAEPDVILLEWEAPGVNAALVERLVEARGNATIVIMTHPGIADDLSFALTAGAAGCLSVNLNSAEFLTALKMLAQGDVLVSREMVAAATKPGRSQELPQDTLTSRELEILRGLARGETNREIAAGLFISEHTVKIHVRHILTKLTLRNRQQAAAYAAAQGLL